MIPEGGFVCYEPGPRQVIWKYALSLGENTIYMPGLVKPLTVGWQGPQLFMWCIVRPAYPEAAQFFHVLYTGQPLPPQLGDYIASAQNLFCIVVHVFRRYGGGNGG